MYRRLPRAVHSFLLGTTLTLKQLPSLTGIGSADWGDCWLGFSYHKIVNYLLLISCKFKKGMMAGERGIVWRDWSVRMSKCQSVKMKNGGGYLKGNGI